MIPKILKTAGAAFGLVQLGQEIYDWFTDAEEKPQDKKPVKSIRKKRDTTRFTQVHYDLIMRVRANQLEHNKVSKDRVSNVQVTEYLNETLCLDKSTRAYSHLWSGDVPRESLATGNPLTEVTNEEFK